MSSRSWEYLSQLLCSKAHEFFKYMVTLCFFLSTLFCLEWTVHQLGSRHSHCLSPSIDEDTRGKMRSRAQVEIHMGLLVAEPTIYVCKFWTLSLPRQDLGSIQASSRTSDHDSAQIYRSTRNIVVRLQRNHMPQATLKHSTQSFCSFLFRQTPWYLSCNYSVKLPLGQEASRLWLVVG